MEAEAISNPGAQGAYMHKNRLQEFAQRASMHLPVYQTFNEGSLHKQQFRSSVIVDGETFVSPCTFVKGKEAEQYVAKFALENILMKIKHEGVPLIHNDAAFCKAILHEYVAKMKMELPTYTTSKSEGPLPSFITTVVFDGNTYRGGTGRSKREAEQLGARTVIEWILGQSDTSIVMAEIIKSKAKLFNTFRRGTGSIVLQDNTVPLKVPLGNHLGDAVAKALGFKRKRTSQEIGPSPRSEGAELVLVVHREGSVKKPNVDSSSGLVQDAEKTPSKLSIQKKTAGSPTAKARLKEICDTKGWDSPSYVLCKEEGPDHQKLFTFKVIVKVVGISLTNLECFGKPKQRKKAAQEAAAEGALWYLKDLGCSPES